MFEDERSNGVEAEGKTVDEAVRKALIMTGWTREQIAVEVLSRASGAWAVGAVTRVRVSRKTGDALDLAQQVTKDVLERMGLSGRVQAERRPDHIQVVVQGEGLHEKLVGDDGEGLDALQHLVARIVSKRSGSRQMVSVDLGGYRQRRERELRDMAYALADGVRQTGNPVMTEPMGASERRVVHLALNEDPDITTFAIGEGLVKSITVAPIDQAPPPEERRLPERRPFAGRGPRGRPGDREGDGGRREGAGGRRWSGPEGGRGPREPRGEGGRDPGYGGEASGSREPQRTGEPQRGRELPQGRGLPGSREDVHRWEGDTEREDDLGNRERPDDTPPPGGNDRERGRDRGPHRGRW